MSSLRKAMDPVRAMKAVFVFANYGLIDHKHESGDGYDAFRALLSDQEDATAQESSLPSLHRGRHIMDDAPSSESESEADDAAADPPSEVKWNLPKGFTLGKEPSKLDASLVGSWIYLRWKSYGWQLGKIYETVTIARPRLFKKFNYRIQRFSGPTTQRGPPRSRWTTMHMEKMLPLTHGCSWFARKTRLRPRTRDSEWLHVGGFGTRYSVVYVAVIAAVV